MPGRSATVAEALALEPTIVAVSSAMFLMGLGENLWRRFLPKYLDALGAPVVAIGLFGTTEALIDGLYQYPGGWAADRFGRRRALLLFIALAAGGYAIFFATQSWPWLFAGLLLVMAWTSMASPALFAIVGDALPRERRTMGFTVQSVLRRVPITIGPAVGGYAIASYGIRSGIRLGLMTSIVLAAGALIVVSRLRVAAVRSVTPIDLRALFRALPTALRWLLLSDILIRICEGLVEVFLVLYAINIVGLSAARFGALIAVQTITSIVSYIPAARAADRGGRRPFVIATFIAFSAFPLAVVVSGSFAALVGAFVIGGLRELGEPARKALIVDLSPPSLRARAVGFYYLLRSAAVAPAAVVGGVLWKVAPALPFYLAASIGVIGTMAFARTVDERHVY